MDSVCYNRNLIHKASESELDRRGDGIVNGGRAQKQVSAHKVALGKLSLSYVHHSYQKVFHIKC